MKLFSRFIVSASVIGGCFTVIATAAAPEAGALDSTCRSISKALVVQSGYTTAKTPTVTNYNYTRASANAAHSVGTTLDFGATSVVVSCLNPADLTKTATLLHKPAFTPTSFIAYYASANPGFAQTSIMGVPGYTRNTTGAVGGLGSMARLPSVRQDMFAVGQYYVVILRTVPTIVAPSFSLKYLVLGINRTL